jgi:hypothetical protein
MEAVLGIALGTHTSNALEIICIGMIRAATSKTASIVKTAVTIIPAKTTAMFLFRQTPQPMQTIIRQL